MAFTPFCRSRRWRKDNISWTEHRERKNSLKGTENIQPHPQIPKEMEKGADMLSKDVYELAG
jgi:hypothetical protein